MAAFLLSSGLSFDQSPFCFEWGAYVFVLVLLYSQCVCVCVFVCMCVCVCPARWHTCLICALCARARLSFAPSLMASNLPMGVTYAFQRYDPSMVLFVDYASQHSAAREFYVGQFIGVSDASLGELASHLCPCDVPRNDFRFVSTSKLVSTSY